MEKYNCFFNDVINEIKNRDACFFNFYSVTSDINYLDECLLTINPELSKMAAIKRKNILNQTLALLKDSGANINAQLIEVDDILIEILRSVSDIIWSGNDYQSFPGVKNKSVEEVLGEKFQYKMVAEKTCYVSTKRGPPLVLINALGMPLDFWINLLDDAHGFNIIIPMLSCSPSIKGGMNNSKNISACVDEIVSMLNGLSIDQPVTVLGWCNAGRVAIKLAEKLSGRISQLILLSPTFRHSSTLADYSSPFEEKLEKLFGMVIKNNLLAPGIAKMIKDLFVTPSWSDINPADFPSVVFAMPARKHSEHLIKPMIEPESFKNYALTTHKSENMPLSDFISEKLTMPVFMLQGEHDHTVNNKQSCAWLAEHADNAHVYTLSGAGHYIQYLQYPYLKWFLNFIFEQTNNVLPCRLKKKKTSYHYQHWEV